MDKLIDSKQSEDMSDRRSLDKFNNALQALKQRGIVIINHKARTCIHKGIINELE